MARTFARIRLDFSGTGARRGRGRERESGGSSDSFAGAGLGGFADFFQETSATGSSIPGELRAIGDVVEQRTTHRELAGSPAEL